MSRFIAETQHAYFYLSLSVCIYYLFLYKAKIDGKMAQPKCENVFWNSGTQNKVFRVCPHKTPYFLYIYIFIFSELASGRNPPNPAIWLVPRAGSFLRSCPLTRAESLAALFTSLFVICEWAKPVILNHFSFKTSAIISVS